jgi:Arc/MetJ family transcription regulator
MKSQLDKRQNIRLDEAMVANVSALAEVEDRTVSAMLRILVREGLAARSNQPRPNVSSQQAPGGQ